MTIKDLMMNMTRNKSETLIQDGMGNYHEGYYCIRCNFACPYWVTDIEGHTACYKDMYMECNRHN